MTQAQAKLAERANKACFLLHKRLNEFKNISVAVIMDLFHEYMGALF